jgi:hypothetical protein
VIARTSVSLAARALTWLVASPVWSTMQAR